jgi:DNA-binding Lrp family transcriptional regulator
MTLKTNPFCLDEPLLWNYENTKFISRKIGMIIHHSNKNFILDISEIARLAGLPITTTHEHFKKLISIKLIIPRSYINYRKLDLVHVHVFYKDPKINMIDKKIGITDFWTYYAKFYSCSESGIYVRYLIPLKYVSQLLMFIDKIKTAGYINDYEIKVSEYYLENPITFDWYDFSSRKWIFKWDLWSDEIDKASSEFEFADSKTVYELDEIDLKILENLEKNPLNDLSDIARLIGVTPQIVHYHYHKHLITNKILLGFYMDLYPFPYKAYGQRVSSFYLVNIMFENNGSLARYMNSIRGKTLVKSVWKNLGEDSLLIAAYLPSGEATKLLDFILNMKQKGLAKHYKLVLLDLETVKRNIIPYNLYNISTKEWKYNIKSYLTEIENLSDDHSINE